MAERLLVMMKEKRENEMILIDFERVKSKEGDFITWSLWKDYESGEFEITGEAINMKTKCHSVGSDEKKAKGIFERMFKR